MFKKISWKYGSKEQTGINFISFQRKLTNPLNIASMGGQGCLSCVDNQIGITISHLITLSMLNWTSPLCQWELSIKIMW